MGHLNFEVFMIPKADSLNATCDYVSRLIGEAVIKFRVSGENIDLNYLVQHFKSEFLQEQNEERKFYLSLAIGMLSVD
ncbi:hypothetical protein NUF50_001661 [Yersinia enterocolitica]|nr:hypothetical protein [Yersinia enterocolitica]